MKKICCILAFLLLLLAGSAVDAAGPINGTDISKTYALPDGYGWWTPSRT